MASLTTAATLSALMTEWRIKSEHVVGALEELGVETPSDILELDTEDVEEFISDVSLKKIEAKRFRNAYNAMVAAAALPQGETKDDSALDLAVLNEPGFWDFMISHTQRNGKAVALAEKLAASLRNLGFTVWLDVDMGQRSAAAMEEGVRNCKCVIAIITGVTDDGKLANAYFSRPFCLSEMQWAIDSGVFIQPVFQMEDKDSIGTFLGQAPDHLKFVGNIDWILLIRSVVAHWKVCVQKICKSVEINQVLSSKMKEMYAASKKQLVLASSVRRYWLFFLW
jgi:hypothetical protein